MYKIFAFLVLCACVPTMGTRLDKTNVTSVPPGAEICVVHDGNIYDVLYEDYYQTTGEGGKVVSFIGVTPLKVAVPKGAKTKIVAKKAGYKPTTFTIQSKKEASYFEGRNKECLADKYYIYATPFMVWDEFIMKYVYKGIKEEYCTEIRHSYHVNLMPM